MGQQSVPVERKDAMAIKKALHEIDPMIYLCGEGWNFGEVGNDAFGINATQANMVGMGMGTFGPQLLSYRLPLEVCVV